MLNIFNKLSKNFICFICLADYIFLYPNWLSPY